MEKKKDGCEAFSIPSPKRLNIVAPKLSILWPIWNLFCIVTKQYLTSTQSASLGYRININ